MIKVASYCRVSTDKEDQANSFEAQQRYFREYIERKPDWELYRVYADEGITGTSTKKRAQFNQMISDAHEGKFRLIITKEVSRFSRNILDTIAYTRELKAIGVGVLFMTDAIHTLEPDAELRLSIMASIAQEESRRTSHRVVWGQTRQMEKGVVFGQSLLGYDVKNGKMTVNPEGAEIVKLIFHKYAVEQISTCEIAGFLTNGGYRTCIGSTGWTPGTIIKILKNEKYTGDLVQKKSYTVDYLTHEKRQNRGEVPKIMIKNHHEPIISREVWNLAQERLHRNDKHGAGNGSHSNRYAFSGKIKCGECGASFSARKKYRKDGSWYRRWYCHTMASEGSTAQRVGHHRGCNVGRILRDDDAMEMLQTAIRVLRIDTTAIIDSVTALALEAIRAGENGTAACTERLRAALDRTMQKKENMMDSFFSGDISPEEMQTMKARYERQTEELQEKLRRAQVTDTERRTTEQLRAELRAEVTALLNCKRESEVFCKNILDHITVFKDRRLELRLNQLPLIFRFADENPVS